MSHERLSLRTQADNPFVAVRPEVKGPEQVAVGFSAAELSVKIPAPLGVRRVDRLLLESERPPLHGQVDSTVPRGSPCAVAAALGEDAHKFFCPVVLQ